MDISDFGILAYTDQWSLSLLVYRGVLRFYSNLGIGLGHMEMIPLLSLRYLFVMECELCGNYAEIMLPAVRGPSGCSAIVGV